LPCSPLEIPLHYRTSSRKRQLKRRLSEVCHFIVLFNRRACGGTIAIMLIRLTYSFKPSRNHAHVSRLQSGREPFPAL
jgi:hypothetical protein